MKIVFNDENHTSRTSAVDFDVTPGGVFTYRGVTERDHGVSNAAFSVTGTPGGANETFVVIQIRSSR